MEIKTVLTENSSAPGGHYSQAVVHNRERCRIVEPKLHAGSRSVQDDGVDHGRMRVIRRIAIDQGRQHRAGTSTDGIPGGSPLKMSHFHPNRDGHIGDVASAFSPGIKQRFGAYIPVSSSIWLMDLLTKPVLVEACTDGIGSTADDPPAQLVPAIRHTNTVPNTTKCFMAAPFSRRAPHSSRYGRACSEA